MSATVELLTFDDKLSLPLTETTDDWLARDHDVESPVYLFVYPSHTTVDPRCSRWSIVWPVGGRRDAEMTAWRHIHADVYDNEAGLETDPPRYVYAGAITKTTGPGTMLAKRFVLGRLSLSMRKKIEELAASTPLYSMKSESWVPSDEDSQVWIRELLNKMVACGIISAATRDRVIQEACRAFIVPHSPLVLHLCE